MRMYQTWCDQERRWRWVISDGLHIEQSKRTFDTELEAKWDAERHVHTIH